MKSIDVSIAFLFDHEETCSSAYGKASMSFSCPLNALPNIGDIMNINGITYREGDLIVRHRAFQLHQGELCGVTLHLGIEEVLIDQKV